MPPSWYSDNIYHNQSIEDSDCEKKLSSSASFPCTTNNNSRQYDINGNNHTNNININITNSVPKHNKPTFEDLYDFDLKVGGNFKNFLRSIAENVSIIQRYNHHTSRENATILNPIRAVLPTLVITVTAQKCPKILCLNHNHSALAVT